MSTWLPTYRLVEVTAIPGPTVTMYRGVAWCDLKPGAPITPAATEVCQHRHDYPDQAMACAVSMCQHWNRWEAALGHPATELDLTGEP